MSSAAFQILSTAQSRFESHWYLVTLSCVHGVTIGISAAHCPMAITTTATTATATTTTTTTNSNKQQQQQQQQQHTTTNNNNNNDNDLQLKDTPLRGGKPRATVRRRCRRGVSVASRPQRRLLGDADRGGKVRLEKKKTTDRNTESATNRNMERSAGPRRKTHLNTEGGGADEWHDGNEATGGVEEGERIEV